MSIDGNSVHPDEGMIHAWLDGALSAGESAGIEAHVAECEACAAAVAEARGLIAGASRVLTQLDDAPAALMQVASTPSAGARPRESSVWRLLRVTPARAAIAATLIVAFGVVLTQNRVAVEGTPAATADVKEAPRLVLGHEKPDSLLSSAIVAKLKAEQPVRVLSRAKDAAMPTPPASAPVAVDASAPLRVAAARASIEAQRDSAVPADRARVGFAPSAASGTASALQQMNVAGKAAENAGAAALRNGAVGAPSLVTAGNCYRVETTNAKGASWGTIPLPVTLAFDSTGRLARVFDATGKATDELTTASVATADSLRFQLRRIGYQGSIQLGAGGETRSGLLESSPATLQLSEVVVTGAVTGTDTNQRRADSRREARAPAAAPAPVAAPAPTLKKSLADEASSSSRAAVSVRRISCPPR